MSTASPPPARDECYRCGYDLRGIDNSHPCPECGLLAERSRRPSDELHDTRPRWLRRLSWGVWLILLSIVIVIAWPMFAEDWLGQFPVALSIAPGGSRWWELLPWIGPDLGAMVFWIGALLLTAPEGHPPADLDDAKLRGMVRWAAFTPLLALIVNHVRLLIASPAPELETVIIALVIILIGVLPLPLLIFLRLRGLAKRARSAHLAEHCLIVGIGASLSLVFIAAASFVISNADNWFGEFWMSRSTVSLALEVIMGTSAGLFIYWSVYLLVRFGIAFAIARRRLGRKWKRDDRSLVPAETEKPVA